jgi:NADPH-dependent 2,4-dienoyl-CoA reductase/sulfur reductase-like enzyme
MPYNIADPRRGIEDLIVRSAEVFRKKQGIDLLTGYPVSRIDRNSKIVTGTSLEGKPFAAAYDKLLIATGAAPIMPDVSGSDLPGVMTLKTLEDGRRIKNFITQKNVRQVVIIGMGYIALEMCESLRALDLEVSMVKPNPRFLPWLEENLAAVVKKTVTSNAVQVYAGHDVQRIDQTDAGYRVVCRDLSLDCDMVLVGIGVTPNSEIAAAADIELGPQSAIAVDRALKTSDKDIYAAGDCADAFHVVTGQKTWMPLALRASRAGWAVADNVCGGQVQLPGVAGSAAFKVFDMQVAGTGLNLEQARQAGFDPVENMIKTQSRGHAYPGAAAIWVNMIGDRKTGRLLGVQMVGRESVAHRINAPAVALHAQMTVAQFSQTDMAYAPPFGPTWDPCLTAANQLLKKL